MLERGFERASGFHPHVGVVIAEPLIEERLAFGRRCADAVFDDAQIRDQLRGHQLRVFEAAVVLVVVGFGLLFLVVGLLVTRLSRRRGNEEAEQQKRDGRDEDAMHGDDPEYGGSASTSLSSLKKKLQ